MTHKESNQKRLPDSYWLQRWVTSAGVTWEVYDKITDSFLVRGQKTPKAAVDLALKLISIAAQRDPDDEPATIVFVSQDGSIGTKETK